MGSSSLFIVRVVDGLKKGWRGLSRDEAVRDGRIGLELLSPNLWRSIWENMVCWLMRWSRADIYYRVIG